MITIIFGENGVGKTCLMTYIGNERAFDRERNRAMQRAIKFKNASGFHLTVPQHCVASNYSITFHKRLYKPRRPRIINPFKLGFQTEDAPYKTHFLLPYETILIDEAQKYFPNRETNFPAFRSNLYEEQRHHHIDLYLATPDAILIHKNVRRLAWGLHVIDRKVKYNKYGTMNIIWTVNRIKPGYIDAYLDAKPEEKTRYCTTEKIKAPYNVYKLYDSEGCDYRFYEGHMDEDFDLNYDSVQPITKEEYINYIKSLDDGRPKEKVKK